MSVWLGAHRATKSATRRDGQNGLVLEDHSNGFWGETIRPGLSATY